ncbi:unnamed protein product [Oikopleura dioica]|uniref:Uncharacterized protein n=1 Tax=Oikopleura dioica TaxID=34765 RepID=E4XD32_OIKDI|nr:unnamed protein product [Oikopleura dioica]
MRIAKNINHNKNLNKTENISGEELITRQNGALELALEDEIKGFDVVIFHETSQKNVLWHSQILMPDGHGSFPTLRISIPPDANIGKYTAKILVNETRFSIEFFVLFESHRAATLFTDKIFIPTGSGSLIQTQEFEVAQDLEEFLKLVVNDMRGVAISKADELIRFLISKNRDRSYTSLFSHSNESRSCKNCYANCFGSIEKVAAIVGACSLFGCSPEILCSYHTHNFQKPAVEEYWKAPVIDFYIFLNEKSLLKVDDGTSFTARKHLINIVFEKPRIIRCDPQSQKENIKDTVEFIEIKDENKNLAISLINATRGDFKLEITIPQNKSSGKIDGQAVITEGDGNLVTILAENFPIAKIPSRHAAVKVNVDIEYKLYQKYLARGRFIRLAFRYSTSKDSKLGFIALPITDPCPHTVQRFLTGAMVSSDGTPLEVVVDPRNIQQRILKPKENIVKFQVPFDEKEIVFHKLEEESLTRITSLDPLLIKFPERKPNRPVTIPSHLTQSISKSITRPNWPLPPPQKHNHKKQHSISSEISSASSISSFTSDLTTTSLTEDTCSSVSMPSKLSTISSHSSLPSQNQPTSLSDISSVTDTVSDTESTLTEASVNTIKKQPNHYKSPLEKKVQPQHKPVTYDIMIVPHRHFQEEADAAISSGDLRLIISGTNGRKSNELVVKNRTCSFRDSDAIGKPKELTIKHSNSDRVWLLDYVCVKSSQHGRQLFPFNDCTNYKRERKLGIMWF